MTERMELDWLKRWALYSPQAEAIRCADSGRSFSYRELYERSGSLAIRLWERFGIARGDRVALLAQNEPETIFLFFALARLGAMLVPVNFRLTAREVDHVLADSDPRLFIHDQPFLPVVEKLEEKAAPRLPFSGADSLASLLFGPSAGPPPEFAGELADPVMILYTSGTTGAPKGALITNKMLFWNSVNTGLRLNLTQRDSAVIFHPLFHTSGWNVLTTPFLHHGGRILMLKKFDPARVLELLEKEKITVLFGVPTMMDMMARTDSFARADLRTVRYAVVGGEPMPVPLIRVWGDKGIPVRQGYGLTEFGPNVFSLAEEDAIRKIGSIGFPNFYIDVKVVQSASGQEVRQGEIGELCLRGPACMPGYWRNEKATQSTIRDNWLFTGDLVRQDEDGYFYVVGRCKEMFISGGENVYPAEVEQFIRRNPRVHEVAVVGVKDEKWGEVGRCFYSTNDKQPIPEEELRAFCQTGLAKFKVPKVFVHLPELPKGDSGKIQRRALPVS